MQQLWGKVHQHRGTLPQEMGMGKSSGFPSQVGEGVVVGMKQHQEMEMVL